MDISRLKIEINDWLEKYFEGKGSYNRLIYEAMEYSIKVGGKRIRPILMLCTANIYKDDYECFMPIACALEMIHTYSLIHDDLPCMDNDDLRRGKPTNHKVYGEAIAVLAGDGLLNEAMNIMFELCLKGGKKELEACSIISKSAGVEGMIGGQVVDIISEGKEISDEQLFYMHEHKTGKLIKAAIVAGAILGGAKEEDIRTLSIFGEKLGLAFQIKDDILDVIGNTKTLGKNINSDKNNNKTNFVSKFGLKKCEEMCKSLTDESLSLLDRIYGNTENLKNITLFLLEREY
ncbi:polyprenyl synthetase family protein [Clostridium sp.]|uniref:polyprenyl synthetase family protein n=1 Tax=Clostridium sp. TaxID=1506 RepID=UPI0039F5BC92